MNDFLEIFMGKDTSMESKIFNISAFGLLILILGKLILNVVLRINYLMIFVHLILAMVIFVILILANTTKKYNLYATIACVFMNASMLFYTRFISVSSSYCLYFVIGIILTILLFNGKQRYILLILEIVLYFHIIIGTQGFTKISESYNIFQQYNIGVNVSSENSGYLLFNDLFFTVFSLGLSVATVIDGYEKQNKELNDINNYLNDLALKDSLTKLWNRKFMDDWFSKKENINDLSVVLFDIDNFKKINDTFGHQVGDDVLKHVTSIIRKNIHSDCFPIRYGGEEFLILFPKYSNLIATRVADNIRKTVKRNVKIPEDSYIITISGGVATAAQGMSSRKLIKRADDNLYRAKNSGKNKIVN